MAEDNNHEEILTLTTKHTRKKVVIDEKTYELLHRSQFRLPEFINFELIFTDMQKILGQTGVEISDEQATRMVVGLDKFIKRVVIDISDDVVSRLSDMDKFDLVKFAFPTQAAEGEAKPSQVRKSLEQSQDSKDSTEETRKTG